LINNKTHFSFLQNDRLPTRVPVRSKRPFIDIGDSTILRQTSSNKLHGYVWRDGQSPGLPGEVEIK